MPLCRELSSRTKLKLTGEDRVRFLHGMVTNDVEALAPGQGCHAAMLTTKGKMLADLVVYADEDALLLELDGSLRDKIKAVFDKHIIMDDVEVTDVSDELAELGVYGEDAAFAIERALGVAVAALSPYAFVIKDGVRVARAVELGIAGYHLFGAAAALSVARFGGQPLSAEEFEERRIEAGTPLYGVDMGEDRLPIEAGVTDAVSFTKGCYLGQEVIARATNLGHINRKLVGLYVDGLAPLARGAKLSAASRPEAGVVTSSVYSPRLHRTLALAYVHRTLWDPGTELTVHDAAGERAARVTTLPFA
jgi:aminomethyltransferase